MNITVYIHPQRLLVATWQVEDSIPVLCGYKELAPDNDLDLRSAHVDHINIVLYSADVRMHWFPVGENESLSSRSDFEYSAWFDGDNFLPLPSETFTSVLTVPNSTMRASVSVDRKIAHRIARLADTSARISVDLDLDIQAALRSTKPRTAPWLLVGRRGSMWHALVINEQHYPSSYASFKNDDEYSYSSMLSLILHSVANRFSIDLQAVMVFGDFITAEDLGALKATTELSGILIARSQPFKQLHSVLDSQAEQRIIKRAHAIAPLAGSMFTT